MGLDGRARNGREHRGVDRWFSEECGVNRPPPLILRHNDQDSAGAVRAECPQCLELMRGQLSVPPGGVPEPDQPIVTNSPYYRKVVLPPVPERHDHGHAQGGQVVESERGPMRPESVGFHGVREIGKGGSRELGERAVLEAHCADALGNGGLGGVNAIERAQDRRGGGRPAGFVRALLFYTVIPERFPGFYGGRTRCGRAVGGSSRGTSGEQRRERQEDKKPPAHIGVSPRASEPIFRGFFFHKKPLRPLV